MSRKLKARRSSSSWMATSPCLKCARETRHPTPRFSTQPAGHGLDGRCTACRCRIAAASRILLNRFSSDASDSDVHTESARSCWGGISAVRYVTDTPVPMDPSCRGHPRPPGRDPSSRIRLNLSLYLPGHHAPGTPTST